MIKNSFFVLSPQNHLNSKWTRALVGHLRHILTRLLVPAVMFARKTNTIVQVMRLNWHFKTWKKKSDRSINFFSIEHFCRMRPITMDKKCENFRLTAQLKFSRWLNLLKFIRYNTLIHTYQIINTITLLEQKKNNY